MAFDAWNLSPNMKRIVWFLLFGVPGTKKLVGDGVLLAKKNNQPDVCQQNHEVLPTESLVAQFMLVLMYVCRSMYIYVYIYTYACTLQQSKMVMENPTIFVDDFPLDLSS